MKKILNNPSAYVDDMLKGIYAAHSDRVRYAAGDPHCYCTVKPVKKKVALVTGGGSGHLPLFLGYVGQNMLDGCAVGGVFQPPSAERITNVCKEVDGGAGILFIYGNYTGDIINFDMAVEFLDFEGVKTRSIVCSDDVNSADSEYRDVRRGVAGIFFMFKCAGAKAAEFADIDEVFRVTEKAKKNIGTAAFAFTPCVIPGAGKPTFTLDDNEMSMGIGIHGEPGVWTGPIKTARELAAESIEAILSDVGIQRGDEVAVLVNGLGATSIEELYILYGESSALLKEKGISIYRPYIGEYATSLEMAGASVSLMKLDDELKALLDVPACTPFWSNN